MVGSEARVTGVYVITTFDVVPERSEICYARCPHSYRLSGLIYYCTHSEFVRNRFNGCRFGNICFDRSTCIDVCF